MSKKKRHNILLTENEKEDIDKAARKKSRSFSSFAALAAVEKADKVNKDHK